MERDHAAVAAEIHDRFKPIMEILERYSKDDWEDISFSMGMYRMVLAKISVEMSGLCARSSTQYVGEDAFGNKMRKRLHKMINSATKNLEKTKDDLLFHHNIW